MVLGPCTRCLTLRSPGVAEEGGQGAAVAAIAWPAHLMASISSPSVLRRAYWRRNGRYGGIRREAAHENEWYVYCMYVRHGASSNTVRLLLLLLLRSQERGTINKAC